MTFLSLALFICAFSFAAGQDVLSLNVYASNAPSNALDIVAANASAYYSVLLNAEPTNYVWINPGEAIPDSRKLAQESEMAMSKAELLDSAVTEPVVAASSQLRGVRSPPPPSRRLMSSCPTSCAKSSSTSCKQLGCAYCGTRCRRRVRQLLLSTVAAASVETAINVLLLPLCGIRLGCSIYSKIYRVTWVNGTAIQTALV